MLEDNLQLLYHLRLCYLLALHHRRVVGDDLSVLDNLLHEPRPHHATVIGDSIIEGEDGYRRTLSLIAYAHPRQRRLGPVHILSVLILLRKAYARRRVAGDRNVKVVSQTEVMEVLDVPLRIVVIVFVYNAADANIRANEQSLRQIHTTVASAPPVVVLHISAVHIPYAATSLHILRSIAESVVENGHDARSLEHRTRFHEVADGMIVDFPVLSVETFFHIDNGLDITRFHVHDNSHSHLSVYLLQFIDDGALSDVLHLHVNGRHDVGTVDRRCIGDIQILRPYFPPMDDTVRTAEDGVVLQFESASCRILCAEHIADGALGQRTEGAPTGVELLPVETALELRQPEHRQVLNLGEGAVVDALVPYRPVLAALVMALGEVGLELCR